MKRENRRKHVLDFCMVSVTFSWDILILCRSSTHILCNGIIAILWKSIEDQSSAWICFIIVKITIAYFSQRHMDFPLLKKRQVNFPKHLDIVMAMLTIRCSEKLCSLGHNLLLTFACSACICLEGKCKRAIFITTWLCCHYMQLNLLE